MVKAYFVLFAFLLCLSLTSSSRVVYHAPQPLKKPSPGGYQKPEIPAKNCIRTIIQINDFDAYDPDNQCIGCDPVQDAGCPTLPAYGINSKQVTCQKLIDSLHRDCDGVELPEGYYYDPKRTITGRWGPEVKMKLNIAIGRCGCKGSWGYRDGPAWGWIGVVVAIGVGLVGV